MNIWAFGALALLTLGAVLASAFLPRLIHAALAFALTFVGLAALYFMLGAEFVGLVLVFVYVGAVAVLIVFTILLTRRGLEERRGFRWGGAFVAVAVFTGLCWGILQTRWATPAADAAPIPVRAIGELLMTDYVWPLLAVGVLLTVSLLGALIVAMEEKS